MYLFRIVHNCFDERNDYDALVPTLILIDRVDLKVTEGGGRVRLGVRGQASDERYLVGVESDDSDLAGGHTTLKSKNIFLNFQNSTKKIDTLNWTKLNG